VARRSNRSSRVGLECEWRSFSPTSWPLRTWTMQERKPPAMRIRTFFSPVRDHPFEGMSHPTPQVLLRCNCDVKYLGRGIKAFSLQLVFLKVSGVPPLCVNFFSWSQAWQQSLGHEHWLLPWHKGLTYSFFLWVELVMMVNFLAFNTWSAGFNQNVLVKATDINQLVTVKWTFEMMRGFFCKLMQIKFDSLSPRPLRSSRFVQSNRCVHPCSVA